MAGLLALPAGLADGRKLIRVINLRLFGWSLQSLFPPELFSTRFCCRWAALLAGIYPGLRLARSAPLRRCGRERAMPLTRCTRRF